MKNIVSGRQIRAARMLAGIACVEALEHLGELRSVAASAADLLGVDLGAACSMQFGVL